MSKKILIAENSRLVKTFISSVLEDCGFEVVTADNGYEVFVQLRKEAPDCILCEAELPVISGFELSRIVKNRESMNLPVVLFTITDEDYSSALVSNSLCDKIISIDTTDENQLKETLLRIFDEIEEKERSKNKETDSQVNLFLVKEITKFYQSESELLNIIKALYTIYSTSQTPREIALNVLDALLDFVPYDIVLLSVIAGDSVHDFCRIKEALPAEEIEDFKVVSHNFFENNCYMKEQLKYADCVYNMEGTVPDFKAKSSLKIKAIESASMYGNDFIGTITIGSTKSEAYHEKNSANFQYFTEKLSPYAENVVNSVKMGNAMLNLRKAFSSFVPEEIIDDLIKKADLHTEQAGEKRKVAVLICDIRSFTNISEGNKPEDVVGFLNTYFAEMVEIIKSFGGSIDKFMGDAIMALFGAPISYQDNAQRAVKAALAMVQKLPQIDSSHLVLPEGYDKLSIGIGIHYGEAIWGSIGSSQKKDYTVIGDTVNLASRLEGLTKMYGKNIIVSDSVAEDLDENFCVHRLDKVAVKGKKIPVSIFGVEAETHTDSDEQYRNYAKALELYEAGAWMLAKGYFEKAESSKCYQKAARIMVERCRNYIENPPENWNGSIVLTSK